MISVSPFFLALTVEETINNYVWDKIFEGSLHVKHSHHVHARSDRCWTTWYRIGGPELHVRHSQHPK